MKKSVKSRDWPNIRQAGWSKFQTLTENIYWLTSLKLLENWGIFQQRGGGGLLIPKSDFNAYFFAKRGECFWKVCQGPVQCSLMEQDPAIEQGGQVRDDQPPLTFKLKHVDSQSGVWKTKKFFSSDGFHLQ